MSVRNIGGRYLSKCILHRPYHCPVPNHPHPVPDSVIRHKIIDGQAGLDLGHQPFDGFILPVGQEYGTGMGIGSIHMADTVNLLILPCILMLLYDAVYIIVNRAAGHHPGLAAPVHGQLIQIIILLSVRHIDAFLNLPVQCLPCPYIYPVIICIHILRELGLSPVNV